MIPLFPFHLGFICMVCCFLIFAVINCVTEEPCISKWYVKVLFIDLWHSLQDRASAKFFNQQRQSNRNSLLKKILAIPWDTFYDYLYRIGVISMAYSEVLQQVKKKQIKPVYLLYGTESYFIQNITKYITKAVLPDESNDNLSTYDLEETSIQEVIADAETYPFFGEKKLIIASNATFLKAKPDKLSFEHDLEVLSHYLTNPVEYSVIVLIAPYEKIDERKKVSKALKKNGVVAACNPIKDYELKSWITNLAGSLKITIEEDAYEMLETELSTDLHLLRNELTKLALYVGEGGVVTKEIAVNLISHTASNSSLLLVDAVIEHNLFKAISIYKDLEKMKEEPIGLIALLAFQFRTILRVKLLKQKGYSQAQMQKQLSTHPYVIKIAMSRESKFTVGRLQDIIVKLTEADANIKQGKMEKELAFELLLHDLVQP
ncbi:DNA polymerase III, delta subunit [Virgibacillus subterraneus]|uniref:DNA polymerase III subunit delta n=2 Tax=Virgibacillus subterraneus TaxID=621109 RepID=A0A1H9DU97_9BACI|nr:DNA polymerase III, delta subunit [Virgibacillus subterraneus]